jgi:hypothetical protein
MKPVSDGSATPGPDKPYSPSPLQDLSTNFLLCYVLTSQEPFFEHLMEHEDGLQGLNRRHFLAGFNIQKHS